MKRVHLLFLIAATLVGCQGKDTLFREVPPIKSGITFSNELAETPELNILTYLYYYNGAGVMAEDFNADGLPDLYFASNQGADAFYLNQGGMRFEEVTDAAGIQNKTGWTTGVTHADVNGDGLQDIYICKASGYRALKGRNLLYINQGPDAKGIPQFREEAEQYGLDLESLSTQAAFFDYDLDGDLDCFLLNHSVHPNRNYGRGSQRQGYDPLAGDVLMRNDGATFTDVSEAAGIFQGKAGYGLGLGISDLNLDGWPDIYVGNDFFENDYLYMNQGDGTFKELIASESSPIAHTSHYSMGNDIADLNNDGAPDIISLDMLPEDLITYKTSGLEYAYPIYQQYLKNGFAPQYMQNVLQLNLGGGQFSEIAFLSGVASTEWSWGSLLADFDNDGLSDIFITNGIKGATNDMDYMNFIANEDIQRRIDAGMQETDMPLTREIPAKKVPNYIFRNKGDLSFADMSAAWLPGEATYSQGCTYADLDADGDLDLIVNHTDRVVSLLENTSQTNRSLQIELVGNTSNTKGVGARVIAFLGKHQISREQYSTRGYLSAVPTRMHIGIGSADRIDSLHVIWPGGRFQSIKDLAVGEVLEVKQVDAFGNYSQAHSAQNRNRWTCMEPGIRFEHRENLSLDFDREPLIAFAQSNQGPRLATADFNQDGRDDFFICGAKRQASALFLQTEDSFSPVAAELFEADALREDTAVLFADVNNDGWTDLLVGSGGNEFQKGEAIQPRLYMNREGIPVLVENAFPDIALNTSQIGTVDLEMDGDLDVLITADAVPGSFGRTPRHYLLANDGKGNFRDVTSQYIPQLDEFGAISSFSWTDLDADGSLELIVAGYWTPIAVFKLDDGKWRRQSENGLKDSNGLWNVLKTVDVDNDGDMDLLAGNWGLNSRFTATPEQPIRLYRNDFDQNGTTEPLVTYFHNGVETPFASRDELVKQMPFLNKKFRTYESFAQASLEELFGGENLANAQIKYASELGSCIFLNDGQGNFQKQLLPKMAQVSAVFDFAIDDFNTDGSTDLMPIGNHHQISTQLGRLDALKGLVLLGDGTGGFRWEPAWTAPLSGACRSAVTLEFLEKKIYIISRNDQTPVFLAQATE